MPYADPEVGRAQRRAYQKTEAGRAAHAAANNAYRQRNKKKLAAHNAISKAVLRGKLTPHPCWVCGNKAEAHHPDYDEPMLVVWLCDSHHKEVHNLGKQLLKGIPQ